MQFIRVAAFAEVPDGEVRAYDTALDRGYVATRTDGSPYVFISNFNANAAADAAVLSKLTGGAVMVVGAGRVNRDQVEKALESLGTVGAQVLGVVMNRLPTKGPDAYSYYGYTYAAERGPVAVRRGGRRARPRGERVGV